MPISNEFFKYWDLFIYFNLNVLIEMDTLVISEQANCTKKKKNLLLTFIPRLTSIFETTATFNSGEISAFVIISSKPLYSW